MNNSAIYLVVAALLCLLSPSIIMALGWFAEQNEKINHDNSPR